jgi:hypothetical protein
VADADIAFVVTTEGTAALAAFSVTAATAAGRRLEATPGRAAGALVVVAFFRCSPTTGDTANFRAGASGAAFAAATRGVVARACVELDADADDAVELSAAAAPHPAVIDAPIPTATTAPPSKPE